MEGTTTYGALPAENAGRLSRQYLEVGIPKNLLEKGITISENQPSNETKIVRWPRYKSLPVATAEVTEGITPPAVQMEREEVSASVSEYIGLIKTTDVLHYFHPDFKVNIATQRAGEQAALTLETLRFNTFKATTNKYYAGTATARTDVVASLTQGLLRKAERALSRQLAEFFTDMVTSTPDFNTEAILPAYLAYCHSDLKYIIQDTPGFTSVKDYGHNIKAMEGEWGSIGNIRFLLSTVYAPYADGGGAKGAMISTGGTSADVYPILIVGRQAWGSVSFKGAGAVKPFVIMPEHSVADPAAQRGYIGWKMFNKAVILNDSWNVVLEVACPELT